jgi:hypothetical protein
MLTNTKDMSGQSKSGDNLKNSLIVNNMSYKMAKSLTNSVSSTTTIQKFQNRVYRGSSTAECVFNSGNDFVDFKDCWLNFSVKVLAPTAGVAANVTAGWGCGSAMNLFGEIKVRDRSGVELDRLSGASRVNNWRSKWEQSKQWQETVGEVVGFNQTGSPTFPVGAVTDVAYSIPLSLLLGFFEPRGFVSAPPQLCSGLSIHIGLNSVQQAFMEGALETGTISDFEISNMQISTRVATKQDSIARAVSQISSSSGLDYMFSRYHSSSSTAPVGSTNIELQLQKAVSFGTQASVIAYADSTPALTVDYHLPLGYIYTSAQFNIGSVYLPLQAISNNNNALLSSANGYLYTRKAWESQDPGHVSYTDYKSGSTGATSISTTLRRSNDLALSGTALNNSKILAVALEYGSLAAATKFVTVLKHDSVVRIYPNNSSVKI